MYLTTGRTTRSTTATRGNPTEIRWMPASTAGNIHLLTHLVDVLNLVTDWLITSKATLRQLSDLKRQERNHHLFGKNVCQRLLASATTRTRSQDTLSGKHQSTSAFGRLRCHLHWHHLNPMRHHRNLLHLCDLIHRAWQRKRQPCRRPTGAPFHTAVKERPSSIRRSGQPTARTRTMHRHQDG